MGILKVQNLKKSYKDPDGHKMLVLDVPDFEMNARDQVAIRGISGSGKTTLLNIIAGILTPDSGDVFINNTHINSLSESGRDRFRATNIGYIFQTFNLLQGLTALENVCLSSYFQGSSNIQRSRELLSQMGLEKRLDYKPRALSTGQQQRVAVARALVNKPQLVIADEPTGNLDPDSASFAIQTIREFCQKEGAALLLVSHDPDVLNQFDNRIEFQTINKAMQSTERDSQ